MMRKLFLAFLILLIVSGVKAQDSTISILKSEASRTITKSIPDTLKKKWIKGGAFTLNVAQSALKDWAAGGENFSIAMNMYANGHAYYKKGKVSWDNTVDINIGYLNTASLGTRKSDDRLDVLSKAGYSIGSDFSLSGLFNLRTQFFDGYTYSDDTATFSSTAFSPGYVLFSPGIDYKPVKNLSVFVSPLTSRWVIMLNPTLSKLGSYGVDSGKHFLSQIGAFGTVTLNTNFSKSITFNSRIDLFSNYEHNPFNVDVYFTNLFTAKFSKRFAVTWNVDMIYDDDTRIFGPNEDGPRLQLKSVVGIGVALKVGT
ncbi:DUF3078 domain-containing protein [Parafilimonas sp.]|uniref:DUF3078 domain-containing protein n=1 Tax=Parafilimonas sp. TaxID=1969739 RepID=UPI0039E412AC